MRLLNEIRNGKVYKAGIVRNNSDCKIVSMIPGDLAVAGCFIFLGGLF